MNSEEDSTTRVTRGALRRRSIDQDTTTNPGTPKVAAASKKLPSMDPIQESGLAQKNPVSGDSSTPAQASRGGSKKEVTSEPKTRRNPRTTSLSEENMDNTQNIKRTPRRRPSQDTTITPQTAPAANRRVTRRNSVTSDDGSSLSSLPVTTPKASKSRLSIAPPTITEDEEKEEEKSNSSLAEADLSDLDVRKLRNRSISASPVTTGKNTSIDSQKTEDVESNQLQKATSEKDLSTDVDLKLAVDESQSQVMNSSKLASPGSAQKLSKENSVSPKKTPSKSKEAGSISESPADEANKSTVVNVHQTASPVENEKTKTPTKDALLEEESQSSSKNQLQRNVTFDETGTPLRQNQSSYPKTPVGSSGGAKRQKLDAETSGVIEIEESIHDSPKDAESAPENSSKSTESAKILEDSVVTVEEQIGTQEDAVNSTLDRSLADMVEDVNENLNKADLSLSILGTPKLITLTEKSKSHFSHLREGLSSTPKGNTEKANMPDDSQEKSSKVSNSPSGQKAQKGEKTPQSWSASIKGNNDQGIDVFSVRKQEEEKREAAESKVLNESLERKTLQKSKSPRKLIVISDEEDEDDEATEQNSFIDDEAMEMDNYQSGDSLDSETRREIEENEIPIHGEKIGSEDSADSVEDEEDDDEEDDDDDEEDDSFIVSDNENESALEGSGDDLGSEPERKDPKLKKRKRIISEPDSSDQEQNDEQNAEDNTVNAQKTAGKTSKSPSKSPKNVSTQKSVGIESASPVNLRKSLPAPGLSGIDQLSSPAKNPKRNTINVLETSPSDIVKSVDNEKPNSNPNVVDPKAIQNEKKSPNASPVKEVSTPKKSSKDSTKQTEIEKSPNKSPVKEVSTPKKSPNDSTKQTEIEKSPNKSRKSLPAPALIGADFYSSSSKKVKRNTINTLEPSTNDDNQSIVQVSENQSKDMVTNPAAIALAKKKRSSVATTITSPTKSTSEEKSTKDSPVNEHGEGEVAMEADVNEKKTTKKNVAAKDISEFDHEAILNRCNEFVRADIIKKKTCATLRQKKKDEKRRQKDEELAENADETMEQPAKKKKKKKKKQINYMLEELGETKEEHLAKALQHKQALLEAKRQRKKAKKAAKLAQQLNKENNEQKATGIGAKFEKKVKKKKSLVEELFGDNVEPVSQPIVKRDISAYAAYKTQIDELKKKQPAFKKKGKMLKDKVPEQSSVDELKQTLTGETKANEKEENISKSKIDHKPVEIVQEKQAKKHEVVVTTSNEQSALHTVESAFSERKQKKKRLHQENSAPINSKISLDEELETLKKSLSEPITKVVKKQKMSHGKTAVVKADVEVTPPRKKPGKLKALTRLDPGFIEEPVTPDKLKLKRNRGFVEEPVTPKAIGFKVSNVLPERPKVEEKKVYRFKKQERIRSEDVQEPAVGLPLPVWTRSGSFEVEELVKKKGSGKKLKAAQSNSDYIALHSGGTSSTEFLIKPLGDSTPGKKTTNRKHKKAAHRIDAGTVGEDVLNFKKQAIFGSKNAPLREKKPKC